MAAAPISFAAMASKEKVVKEPLNTVQVEVRGGCIGASRGVGKLQQALMGAMAHADSPQLSSAVLSGCRRRRSAAAAGRRSASAQLALDSSKQAGPALDACTLACDRCVADACSLAALQGQVILKIAKHCREADAAAIITGQLLGLDVGATLEITDAFPYPVRGRGSVAGCSGCERGGRPAGRRCSLATNDVRHGC